MNSFILFMGLLICSVHLSAAQFDATTLPQFTTLAIDITTKTTPVSTTRAQADVIREQLCDSLPIATNTTTVTSENIAATKSINTKTIYETSRVAIAAQNMSTRNNDEYAKTASYCRDEQIDFQSKVSQRIYANAGSIDENGIKVMFASCASVNTLVAAKKQVLTKEKRLAYKAENKNAKAIIKTFKKSGQKLSSLVTVQSNRRRRQTEPRYTNAQVCQWITTDAFQDSMITQEVVTSERKLFEQAAQFTINTANTVPIMPTSVKTEYVTLLNSTQLKLAELSEKMASETETSSIPGATSAKAMFGIIDTYPTLIQVIMRKMTRLLPKSDKVALKNTWKSTVKDTRKTYKKVIKEQNSG